LDSPLVHSSQFNRPFRALKHAGATSDAAVSVVKDDFARFEIGRPATDGADRIALPNASAFSPVKVDLQPPLLGSSSDLFFQGFTRIHG
jgi:hypothetical protein